MADFDTTLTRENLMRQLDSSWNEFITYLASLTEEQLTGPTDAGGWTAKDHILHLALYDKGELAVLEGKSRLAAWDIAPGTWDENIEDPLNALMQKRYQAMPLAEVMQALRQNHDDLLKKLDTMTEAELLLPYSHYQADSTDERPLLLWLLWDTIHHYQEHTPWIEAIVENK